MIYNLQCNFSSKFPLEVIDKALMNSSNSIEPSCNHKITYNKNLLIFLTFLFPGAKSCISESILTLFSSNTLNTSEANLLGSPCGKNCLYILMNP